MDAQPQTRIGMPPDNSIHLAEHGEIIRILIRALLDHEHVNPNFITYVEMPYILEETSTCSDNARVPNVMVYDQARLQEYKMRVPNWRMNPFILVPDICVKVITPEDKYLDVEDQVIAYLDDGVRLILVINPRQKTIRVYLSTSIIILTEADTLNGGDVLPGFSLPIGSLFT